MILDVEKRFLPYLDTCITPELSCSPPSGVGSLREGDDDLPSCGITDVGTAAPESANRGRFEGLSIVQPMSARALRIS